MIDLSKAIEKVKKRYCGMEIASAGEIENGWILSLENEKGEKLRISPVFVSKETGEIEIFFPPEHREELKNFRKIKL